ncbi:MAG: diacylglycerol kinase family protein [Pyrinomonadaceae bacterium]
MAARVEVIINASSGQDDKEEVRARLTSIFQSCGIEARISLARSGAELERLAAEAAEGPAQVVVAGGGDGTLNAIAARLVGKDKLFGILPLGTLNHFAKDLKIPLDLEAAARTIAEGRPVEVDVGMVNDKIFLNNSSLGLYPRIVRERERQQERLGRGKWWAFLGAALRMFRRYPFFDVRLSADGGTFIRRTPFVFVGNNEYEMNGFNLGGRACLNNGQLSLYVAHRTGRFGLVRLALHALSGRLDEAQDFDRLCAKEIWIETRSKRLPVATDGEVNVLETPLHFTILPGALRALVPQDER